MKEIDINGLLIRVFVPTTLFSLVYLLLGCFCKIPHLLLFCILATVILVPIELGIILFASKKENGTYSLKSAFVGQEKMPIWQMLIISLVFVGIAGLLSAFVAPIENRIFTEARATLLDWLLVGFDWTNYEYIKTFSRPILIFTCAYYGMLNVLIAPITEELFFRGYLTSHWKKQSPLTPVIMIVLFSLYHFWLPFNNIFRILAFTPIAFIAYKKKNYSMCIFFHCFCNLFSVISFALEVLR